jgi:hypothetical protein
MKVRNNYGHFRIVLHQSALDHMSPAHKAGTNSGINYAWIVVLLLWMAAIFVLVLMLRGHTLPVVRSGEVKPIRQPSIISVARL